MAIDSIAWDKLKPHKHDKQHSFEELCFQIARVVHGPGGFRSIDDSGGGDGVEFYQQRPNDSGGINDWGWQAKFYSPNSRLNVSNRKQSIKDSLAKACREHPSLQRWFLCIPGNLTIEERGWFEDSLRSETAQELTKLISGIESDIRTTKPVQAKKALLPGLREAALLVPKVEIEFWGESEFLAWLSESRFTGQRLFFFGDLALSLEWFARQNRAYRDSLGDKFIPQLHQETSADTQLKMFLVDSEVVEDWKRKITGSGSCMRAQVK